MRTEIIGVPVDAVTGTEAAARVAGWLDDGGRGRLVVTPNPEMVVMAQRDPAFLAALRAADLAIPDGVGLLWASRRLRRPLPERVTGTDLMRETAGLAAGRGLKVYLLGGIEPDTAAKAAAELRKLFPELIVAGAESGGEVGKGADGLPVVSETVMAALRAAAPDVLFVAFGHGKQEKWLAANLAKLPSVRVGMGIGGAFDFLAGRARRAPGRMRQLGLEWLWRLIHEPRRAGRIWTAVVTFPLLVLRSKR